MLNIIIILELLSTSLLPSERIKNTDCNNTLGIASNITSNNWFTYKKFTACSRCSLFLAEWTLYAKNDNFYNFHPIL